MSKMCLDISLDELITLLEWLGMKMEDDGYVNLKKSSDIINNGDKRIFKILFKNNLTYENFTTLKQLQCINKIYERKFKCEIK